MRQVPAAGALFAIAILAIAPHAAAVGPESGNLPAGTDPRRQLQAPVEGKFCSGMSVATFEQRVPEQIKRYAFDGAMLPPFLGLWQSAQRPALPAAPEHVTVYVVPERPYLVGFHRQGCVIAFLAVERQQFWRALRPSLGWPA